MERYWRASGKGNNNYGGKGWELIVIVFVLVVAKQGTAQDGIYACWGGCVNQCVMSKLHYSVRELPCYWDCLGNCFSKTASDFKYYCQLGCSFKKCIIIANSSDGRGTEQCLEDCANKICNANP